MSKIDLWGLAMDALKRAESKGTKRIDIAKIIGVEPSTVGRWLDEERGNKRPNVRQIEKIFSAYKLTFREVLMQSLPPEQATEILEALENNLPAMLKVSRILNMDKRKADKLLREVDYLLEDEEPGD